MHDVEQVVVAPEFDRERDGMRLGEQQVLVALEHAQRPVRIAQQDVFGNGAHRSSLSSSLWQPVLLVTSGPSLSLNPA